MPRAAPPAGYDRRGVIIQGAHHMKGAGGTPGGVGQFFIGLLCAVAGGWLLTNQVQVTSGWG